MQIVLVVLFVILANILDRVFPLIRGGMELAFAPWIIPAIISGLGSFFSHKSQQKQEQNQYNAGLPAARAADAKQKARGALLAGLARTYGLDKILPPGYFDTIGNSHSVPQFQGSGGSPLLQGLMAGLGQFASYKAPGEMPPGSYPNGGTPNGANPTSLLKPVPGVGQPAIPRNPSTQSWL